MYYGILFTITPEGKLGAVSQITREKPIEHKIREDVEGAGGNIEVWRHVEAPTDRLLTIEEAKLSARDWLNKFAESKIIEVLEGK
jgi:hypothetical protein